MDRRTLIFAIVLLGLSALVTFDYIRDHQLVESIENLQQHCLHNTVAPTQTSLADTHMDTAARASGSALSLAANQRNIAALEVRVRALEMKLKPLGSAPEAFATSHTPDAHADLSVAQLEQNPAVRAKIADIVQESRREQWRETERNFREMVNDEILTFAQQRKFDDDKTGQIVAAIEHMFGKQREIHEQIRARELSFGAGREKLRELHDDVETQLKKQLGPEDLDALYEVVPMLRGPGPGPGGPPF